MAGTKRKHELAELGDLSGTEKVSNSTVSTTDVKQPSSPVIDDSAPVCYLCLDGDLDDDGQPLRRDCACRGSDAGFVHLECLAEYAAAKSKQASDMNKFVEPWVVCPSCHQYHQNELRIDIATEFVSFVRKQYPRDTQSQVESLYLKLCALMDMLNVLHHRQKREAGVAADEILSLIDRMKGDVLPLPERYSEIEANAHAVHGHIALDEGTEESAKRAVVHFENDLKVSEAIGDDEGIATAKADIAYAKSLYEGGNNNEELVKASQELYELRIAEYGEENEYTIDAGRKYAIELLNANRGGEARELLTKLLATSKQVLGPHHSTTKDVESALKSVNASA